ncbi:MAG: cytidylyltransferase domain-containing protein [Flavobacteriales bacterium]
MLAIIPARGGSKRLPNKNIKLFKEKPLIAYTIEAALTVKEITRVLVSTDDEAIAKVAIQYGAECPFLRPSELATDEAQSIDVFRHAVEEIEKRNIRVDDIIILQPTSPLRTSKQIKEAINLFYDKKADSVVSYCQESHPISWHKYISEEGKFEEIDKNEKSNHNSQTVRKTFFPNGAIYILKKKMLEEKVYYSSESYAYIMEKQTSIDIDTIDDFHYAEYVYDKNHMS